MTLSVCLIVRDEELALARCLDCVKKFADEIIVADTGSVDKTVEIASRYTDKIYFFEWCDDFSAARNFAFSKAGGDYVMWLDADDTIDDDSCAVIRNLVDTGGFDMAYLPYAAEFDGERPVCVYNRERIFLRSMNYRFSGAVHEAVPPRGKIVCSDARIDHKKIKSPDTFRNLRIYQNMIARGISLDERGKFYYGRELISHKMLREGIAILEDFLSGDGWKVNKTEACLNLFYCYMELGKEEEAVSVILKSFLYGRPRAQACCILGSHFMDSNDLPTAVYWYERALDCGDEIKLGGFVNTDYADYIPYLQLCVLYDRLGDFSKAEEYNELAGKVKPQSAEYLFNKRYFENKTR